MYIVTTPTKTQPQHPPPTTETQHQPLEAPDERSLNTTQYNVISKKKQGHNNKNNNNNNKNNKNNNKNNINNNNNNNIITIREAIKRNSPNCVKSPKRKGIKIEK